MCVVCVAGLVSVCGRVLARTKRAEERAAAQVWTCVCFVPICVCICRVWRERPCSVRRVPCFVCDGLLLTLVLVMSSFRCLVAGWGAG